jgi:hypothetical protein
MAPRRQRPKSLGTLGILGAILSISAIFSHVWLHVSALLELQQNPVLTRFVLFGIICFILKHYSIEILEDIGTTIRLLIDCLSALLRLVTAFERMIRFLFLSNASGEPQKQLRMIRFLFWSHASAMRQKPPSDLIDRRFLRSIDAKVPKKVAILVAVISALFIAALESSSVIPLEPQIRPEARLPYVPFELRFTYPSDCGNCGGPANDFKQSVDEFLLGRHPEWLHGYGNLRISRHGLRSYEN